MKQSSVPFGAALIASFLFVGVRTSHAQAPTWRCSGVECEESLINDIEDTINRDWPSSFFILIPGIPYSCQTQRDQCPRCATGGGGLGAAQSGITSTSVQTGIAHAWGITVTGDLRSFLIGRFTADAGVFGEMRLSLDNSTWPGTSIDYDFGEADHEVPAPRGGTTGVQDLGLVNFSTAEGAFWTANVPFSFTIPTADTVLSCTIGYGNQTVLVHPGGPNINISYPVSATPVRDILAEAIRNQFRRAARLVALGLSCPDNGAGACRAPSSLTANPSARETPSSLTANASPRETPSDLTVNASPRETPSDLEVHIGGKVIAWRSDELKAASRPLATIATLTSAEQDRLGSRQGWSLRELVRRKFGDSARVATVIGEDGSRVDLDVPAWRSTDSTPMLRINNRGQFRFQWLGTRSGLPGMKGVHAVEVVMQPGGAGVQGS